MIVYAEGCSLTAGAELQDWQMTTDGYEFSELSWAGKVRKQVHPKAKFFPTARSASSQSHIKRRAIYHLTELLKDHKAKDILFLCQWTDSCRFEFRVDQPQNTDKFQTYNDKNEKHYIGSLPIDLPRTSTLGNKIVDQKDRNNWLSANKVKTIFNDINYYHAQTENMLYRSFDDIYSLRLFCKSHNIKMLETIGFGQEVGYYNRNVTNSEDKFLQQLMDKVDVKNTTHYEGENLGMIEYARNNKYKHGPGGHPLEKFQHDWAIKFMEHYNL